MNKIILQLCADTGSDTKPYKDNGYEVILVGKDIGVENYHPPKNVYGIIANPVCTEFSTARADGMARNPEEGMILVRDTAYEYLRTDLRIPETQARLIAGKIGICAGNEVHKAITADRTALVEKIDKILLENIRTGGDVVVTSLLNQHIKKIRADILSLLTTEETK